MVEEFLEKLPEIDTRYEDIVPMEQVSSMVSNGGGSVTMQRDDEYRNRIMKISSADHKDKHKAQSKPVALAANQSRTKWRPKQDQEKCDKREETAAKASGSML
ncbi:hypothetical protein ACLKA7_016948 [Drosophila subpalustris]